MSDCRFILDNLNDYASQQGTLVTGSDVVDVSGTEMVAGDDGWKVLIKTVNPAQQNPRLQVSAAVYIDADGRMDNNATAGPRLGADTVYGIVSGESGWSITREAMNVAENAFKTVSTKATFSIGNDGFTINIPYDELAKTAPAYWKAGVAEKDAVRLTVDYVPDAGMSCAPAIAPSNSWVAAIAKAKNFWITGGQDYIVASAVVIAAMVVIFWRWKKTKKKKQHDL